MEPRVGDTGTRSAPAANALHSWLRLAELTVPENASLAAVPRLRLLAMPALVLDDDVAVQLERKDAALLALLAFEGPLPRSRVAALLWPDAEPQNARNSLRQRLFRLRRAAGRALVEEDTALRLAASVEHDLKAPADRIRADPEAVAGELLGAFVYEDCDELADWVRSARERFRVLRRDAIAEAAAHEESAGHVARALVYAERLFAEDPLSEQAHRLVMRLHYRRGDRSAALAAYARCRQWLRQELSAEPSVETRELAQLIERSGELPGTSVRPVPAVIARPPLLVGRDREWQALVGAWNSGRVVLLTGDAGMGKTRLLGDFAQAQAIPLIGARPGDARVPYALLTRLLRATFQALPETRERSGLLTTAVRSELARLLPELGTPPPGALNEARFRQALCDVMAAHVAAGLDGIALDDLHFCDTATLELLPLLAGTRLKLALAVRGAECPEPLAAWLRAEDGTGLVEVPLQPLTEAAVHALLESLALPDIDADVLAASLVHHTGGNPFFLLETIGALIARGSSSQRHLPASPTVGALLERRLAQLSPAALRLAQVAALAGVDFDAELAASVLEQHPLELVGAWRELEAAQMVREGSFAHDLIFEAAQRSVPQPIAQVLHKSIGAFLESRGAPPARVAHHWAEGADWHRAAEQFNLAARASFNASRFPEAGEYFRSAASCFERAGAQAGQHSALQELAGCQIKAFDLSGAREVAELLLRISANDDQIGWALDRLIDTLNMGRQDDAAALNAAMEMRRRGLASSNRWMEFNATRKLAVTLAHLGRFEEALALFGTQADWIEANLHEWNVHVWLCDNAYVLDLADRLDSAIESYRRAEALAREHKNWWVVYVAMRNVALTSAWTGRLEAAAAASDDAVHFSGRLGDALVERNPRDSGRRAALLLATGRVGDAFDLLEDACSILRSGGSPFWLAFCGDQLALLYAHVGQPARARELLAQDLPPLPPEAEISRWIARSRAARAGGRGPIPAPGRVLKAINSDGCPTRWVLLAMLENAHAIDAGKALALCRHVEERARQAGQTAIRLHALGLAAERAAGCGDRIGAGDLAAEALNLARQFGPVGISVPELMWGIHRAASAAGDSNGAREAIRRGVQFLELSALPNVPPDFRESFLHRNPTHRALLTEATRQR
ncbi:MAG: ATP-binding protein [Betaproteobacteria bacterium]